MLSPILVTRYKCFSSIDDVCLALGIRRLILASQDSSCAREACATSITLCIELMWKQVFEALRWRESQLPRESGTSTNVGVAWHLSWVVSRRRQQPLDPSRPGRRSPCTRRNSRPDDVSNLHLSNVCPRDVINLGLGRNPMRSSKSEACRAARVCGEARSRDFPAAACVMRFGITVGALKPWVVCFKCSDIELQQLVDTRWWISRQLPASHCVVAAFIDLR